MRLSAARGKTMETATSTTTPAKANASSPSSSRRKRSRSRSRSRGSGKKNTTPTTLPTSSSSSLSSPLGPFLSSLTVPQSWFLHFYALGSLAATAVLGAALRGGAAAAGGSDSTPNSSLPPPSVAALALLLLHVLRRWGECAWQASWPREARMHAVAYAFGMSYYAVLPLSLVPAGAFGAAAAAVRGEGEATSVAAGVAASLLSKLGISSSLETSSPPPSSLQHPASLVLSAFASLSFLRFLGVLIFAAGSLLQAASHDALASLQKKAAASKRQYLAPVEGEDSRLLSLCACPHYLGEIVIYSGLALVAAGGLSSTLSFSFSPLQEERSAGMLPLLVLIWVSVNLALASAETKRWYRRKFPKEFPKERAALVPGVF